MQHFPQMWACGAAGSALPWHGRGRRFDPDQVHQNYFNCPSFKFCRVKSLADSISAVLVTSWLDFLNIQAMRETLGAGLIVSAELVSAERGGVSRYFLRICSYQRRHSVRGNGKFHRDLRLRCCRLSRLVMRLESPLLNGFTRRGEKNFRAADCLNVLDVSIFVDSGQ
jgi:hypothetical protein